MKIIRILAWIIAGLIAIAAVTFLALSLYGWSNVWERGFGSPDLGPIQFEQFAKGPKPNQALICPKDLCDAASVDRESATYALSAEELKFALLEALETREGLGTEDLEQVDNGAEPLQMRFVARTDRMRYPDTVRVRFIDLPDGKSTIALYSQSQVGESDFGVNLERAQRWLAYLEPHEVGG